MNTRLQFSAYAPGLSFLAAITLGVLLATSAGCNRSGQSSSGPENTRLTSQSKPEPQHKAKTLGDGLDKSLSNSANWHNAVDRELTRLTHHIRSQLQPQISRSEFSAPNLSFSGIDRTQFADTFSADRINVRRWRHSDAAPRFETDGLEQLTQNLYQPWKTSRTFRTELVAHKIRRQQSAVVATVVATTHGQIREKSGLDSTSLWEVRWNISNSADDDLELASVQVQAHEEVAYESVEETLFQDITRQVLSQDDTLSNQLDVDIDQWARQIPGIDITGNHGIAIGDPNDDGLQDIYVCQPHGLPNLLLSQNPDGTAENKAKMAKIDVLDDSRAALFVDLDNDGDDDLVVSTSKELLLFSNDGVGVFQLEHAVLAGYDGGSLSAADYDRDGDLDLFVCKYNVIENTRDLLATPSKFGNANNGGRNVLLRNDEGWIFTDVTEAVGLSEENTRFSRCALWFDFDTDGDQDLYVVNEYSTDTVYVNNDGWFSALNGVPQVLEDTTSGRSASLADFNADGQLDVFIASFVVPEAKRLTPLESENLSPTAVDFLQSISQDSRVLFATDSKEGHFRPYRLPSPIFASQTAFGTSAIDMNNDGYEDILITNGLLTRGQPKATSSQLESLWIRRGSLHDSAATNDQSHLEKVTQIALDHVREGHPLGERQRNTCLLGLGQPGFANFSAAAGIDSADDARAIATVDWDSDGDLDIVMTSRNSPQFRILVNRLQSKNEYLTLDLQGKKSNRNAIGARIELQLDNRETPITKVVTAGSGAFSQSSRQVHFGIPNGSKIVRLVVHWPSGQTQTFESVRSGTRYLVVEGAKEPAEVSLNRFNVRFSKPSTFTSRPTRQLTPSVFYPIRGLPQLQFQGNEKSWIPLKTIDDMPMMAIFVDDSDASRDLLRSIKRESAEIIASKLDIVAIKIDGESPDSVEHFNSIKTMAEDSGFPFRYGAASASMLEKMKLLYGDWFSHQHLPQAPFAWFLDKDGNIRIAYPSSTIRIDQVLDDMTTVFAGSQRTAERASPLEGRWFGLDSPADYSRIRARFAELGYEDDEAFEELSRSMMAIQLCRRASELTSQGKDAEARGAYTKALEFNPDCSLTCVEYGYLLIKQSATEPDDISRQALLVSAQKLFERASIVSPNNTKAILGLAEVAKHRNQIDEAINQLNNYLEVNPNRWEVHAIVGRLHFHRKKYRQATMHLLKAWENRPTLPFVAGDLGFLYLHSGAYEDGRSFLRFANRLQPSASDLKRHLSLAEFVTGNYEESIRLLQEVVVEQPNELTPKSLLAWQLATSPFETLRDGKQSLEIALMLAKVNQDSATIHEICAAAYAENGDFENALIHQQKAEEALETRPNSNDYTDMQKQGLKTRLELYKRRRPCRMSDPKTIPIRPPGV